MSGFRESVAVSTATITSGQTKSAAVDLGVGVPMGLDMPAAMTGTTLWFEVSNDNVTYRELYDFATNARVTLTFTAGKSYPLDPAVFGGWRFLKVVSSATEGADRVFLINGRIVA